MGKTVALLRNVGLEVHEAQGVFQLIDTNNSGEVTLDEFVVACVRLRGNSRAVDLASLMFETKRMMASLQPLIEYVKACQSFQEQSLNSNTVAQQVQSFSRRKSADHLHLEAGSPSDCFHPGAPLDSSQSKSR